MENKIKNPVSKKNIFFFSIFDKLINSIEKYVHKTEKDTFAENFDIVNENSKIIVSPKGSTVEQLSLGNKYSTLKIDDENFNAYINISGNDNWIELSVNYDNKTVDYEMQSHVIGYVFNENNNYVGSVTFKKNGISVDSNGGQVLDFTDSTSTLNVTFTVAELIALKALLPTT